MTRIYSFIKVALLVIFLLALPLTAIGEYINRSNIYWTYSSNPDGTITVQTVQNNGTQQIQVMIDAMDAGRIPAGQSANINKTAKRSVRFDYPSKCQMGPVHWTYKAPPAPKPVETVSEPTKPEQERVTKTENQSVPANPTLNTRENRPLPEIPAEDGGLSVSERMDNDAFFGRNAVTDYIKLIDSYCNGLAKASDKHQFARDKNLEIFLQESETRLNAQQKRIPVLAQELVGTSKANEALIPIVIETLNNRIRDREQALNRLKAEFDKIPAENVSAAKEVNEPRLSLNYITVGSVVAVIALLLIIALRRRRGKKGNKKTKPKAAPAAASKQTEQTGDSNIVVRRKTTTMLKRQSLDDVIDNPAYLAINASDFTTDSAVRTIYIKNSCIKEIYGMYERDLRNDDNPKEDGCMVLGRWVYDEANKSYDVSLEYVVLPGDDAVFKEYELNFGGKIKLRVAEKLRKLRKESNLQYDLVCWIHSHPGLGVFFSNSDDNVQTQLKHPQHPNFLTAFVVDILTSDQEMGIFTFKHDGTMNSKGDLTKLYSLEDMYKWALSSESISFNHDSFYNVLKKAHSRSASCKGVELNNNSIIDLNQILQGSDTGLVGWAIGTSVDPDSGKEFLVSSIVKATDRPTTATIGAVLNVQHFSLPTIQRLIYNDLSRLSFVMVYSSKQTLLTTIPIIRGEVVTDERYYGDENIDDLKIWTRRKR